MTFRKRLKDTRAKQGRELRNPYERGLVNVPANGRPQYANLGGSILGSFNKLKPCHIKHHGTEW
jgi:allophanate hydrolase subunit 2